LNRLLGQVPGHVAVGELIYLWEHSLTRDHECGCGKRFTDCEFWSSVGEHAFGGWHNIDGAEVFALQRSVANTTYIPLLVAPWLWPAFNARLQRYADLMGRLFEGIRRASGADVIVDSSKYPAPSIYCGMSALSTFASCTSCVIRGGWPTPGARGSVGLNRAPPPMRRCPSGQRAWSHAGG